MTRRGNKSGRASSKRTSTWRTITTSTSPSSGTCCPSWRGFPTRGQPRAPQPRTAFSSAMFSVRYSIRGRQGRHLRASPQCHTHVPAARPRDGTGTAGPGGTIGVLRRRLVHDAGQHAPGTRWPHQRQQPAVRQATAADGRQLSRLGLLSLRPGLGHPAKEGDFGDGPAGLHTFFGILAGRIPVVVAVNSDLLDDISAVVQASLFAATSPRVAGTLATTSARSPAGCAWISRQWRLDLRGRVHARSSASRSRVVVTQFGTAVAAC